MWRWLLILVIVALALLPSVALAADPTVTITVSKWVVGLPGGLTITYVSDYELDIDWVPGVGSVNTMVRVAYGRPLVDRDDGFELYYGDGDSCTLWLENVGLVSPIYIGAWAESGAGIWSPTWSTEVGNFMSVSFLFFGLIAIAGILTVMQFKVHFLPLNLAASLGWLALGIWLLTGDITNLGLDTTWGQVMGFLFVLMTFVPVLFFLLRMGKKEITVTEGNRSWRMYGKPPADTRTRAQVVKEEHRSRLRSIGQQYARRGRR